MITLSRRVADRQTPLGAALEMVWEEPVQQGKRQEVEVWGV